MKILVDNGHGWNTPGKCSPDGTFKEWKYNRAVAEAIVFNLKLKGYDAELLVPEDDDIPLKTRVERVDAWCTKLGTNNVMLVSVHVNAASNGKWSNATGWSCYTSIGQTKSDALASELYKSAERYFPGRKIRKEFSDGDADWEVGFYIVKNTRCVAVLTENFFMDNKEDLKYISSPEGRKAIIDAHVDAIIRYIGK